MRPQGFNEFDECLPCVEVNPPIADENIEALNIWYIVRGQWIYSYGGPTAINQLAVHEAMRLYEVENKKECFEKILTVAAQELEYIHDKIEAQREQK